MIDSRSMSVCMSLQGKFEGRCGMGLFARGALRFSAAPACRHGRSWCGLGTNKGSTLCRQADPNGDRERGGGGYDVYARVLAAHLADHIPGHPAIVSENMPGAGGLVAINWAYNVAPRDGTVILASFNVVLSTPLFGDQQAKFDPRKFASIGSIGKQQNICATWYTSPIKTLDQAKEQEVTVSAEGVNSNSATLPAYLEHHARHEIQDHHRLYDR